VAVKRIAEVPHHSAGRAREYDDGDRSRAEQPVAAARMTEGYLRSHCRLVTNNLDEAREHVGRMWERHESHLRRGRAYSLRWCQANLRRISLAYIHSGSALDVTCGPIGNHYRFSMPEQGLVYHHSNGRDIEATPSCGVIYAPRQELRLEIEPFRSLLLTIDADYVARLGWIRFGKRNPDPSWTTALTLASPPAATLRSLCRWLGHELDQSASALRTSPRVVDALERSVLTLFFDCLEAVSDKGAGPRVDVVVAPLRRVENWLDEKFREPVGVEDMALVAGTTVRAVQNMFRRHRDCTPSEALLQRRLAYARQRLLKPDPQTTVTDVAFDAGFFHLSRFAQRYALVFGERPSQTLANRIHSD
jgi:AraC-like DNA-binding protein